MIIVKDTHEPIIDIETFEKVNHNLFIRDTRITNNGDISIFSGYLKCNDCERSMTRKNRTSKSYEEKTGKKRYVYYCSTYSRQSHNLCTKHFIKSDNLNNAVLEAIKVQIYLVIDIEKLIKEIMKLKIVNNDEEVFGKNLTMLNNELSRYETLEEYMYTGS